MNNKLLAIGNDVASLWGGNCYDFEIDNDGKQVVFHCVEHGEFFVTTISFDELRAEYGCKIR